MVTGFRVFCTRPFVTQDAVSRASTKEIWLVWSVPTNHHVYSFLFSSERRAGGDKIIILSGQCVCVDLVSGGRGPFVERQD